MSLADILGPQLLDGKETVSTDAALKNVKFVDQTLRDYLKPHSPPHLDCL